MYFRDIYIDIFDKLQSIATNWAVGCACNSLGDDVARYVDRRQSSLFYNDVCNNCISNVAVIAGTKQSSVRACRSCCGIGDDDDPDARGADLIGFSRIILFLRPILPRLFWLAIGVSSIAVMTVLYLLLASSVPDAIRDMILFPFYGYNNASLQKVAFGNWSEMQNFPFILLFVISPVLVGCVIILYRQKILADHALATCGFFFVAATVGCYPRPDIVHIAFNAPLAIPLFALCIARLTCRWPALLRRSLPALLILLASPSVLAFILYAKSVLPDPVTTSSRGAVALHGLQGAQDALARIGSLPKSDKIFFYSYMPMMPFLTGRLQSPSLDIFVPYYTTQAQYRLTCDEMAHVNWAVIQRMSMENWKQSFPLMSLGAPTEFLRFEEALDKGFDLMDTVGGYEFRRRNGKDITAACAKIGGNAF